jgi:hypothetical protein
LITSFGLEAFSFPSRAFLAARACLVFAGACITSFAPLLLLLLAFACLNALSPQSSFTARKS